MIITTIFFGYVLNARGTTASFFKESCPEIFSSFQQRLQDGEAGHGLPRSHTLA